MSGERASISVVVPVWNDSACLAALLAELRRNFDGLEVVVADGGEDSEVREVCARTGARHLRSAPGRGTQLNRGAGAATGEILWFLHADSAVRPGSVRAIEGAFRDPEIVGGAFRFRVEGRRWYGPLLNAGVAIRCGLFKNPFGDQGVFVRRAVFERMGGFEDYPYLEDVDFVRRLKREGRVRILDLSIGVCPRRWEKEGFVRTTLRNWALLTAFFFGVPPRRTARWYKPPA